MDRCIEWDVQAFADEVCFLLDEPDRAREMASRGPAWVRQNRTYEVIAESVNEQYRKLLGLKVE